MDLLENLKKFLNENLDKNKPILLAYSGGGDSSCLLDLLLKYRDDNKIDLHVAHVDHGFREESSFEAFKIQKKMKKLNIVFHLKKLKIDPKKNFENESRNQRFLFFKTLFKKYEFQALITAHHKNDLAETVLKRFLEGANIFSLTSMQKISKFDNFMIFRPLLEISKKAILTYLNKNKINYFLDATNQNTKFLRAKMRVDIFPFLQKNFNKQILDNLAQISNYSLELNNYLDAKTSKILKKMKISPFGSYIDLNEIDQNLELKFIIKKIAKLKNIDISRNILEKLVFGIVQKKPNLRFDIKNANIYIDRGFFFILNDKKNYKALVENTLDYEKVLIKLENNFYFDKWHVKISKIKNDGRDAFSQSYWPSLFFNNLCIYLPDNKYYIKYPAPNKYLKKLWENSKVPAFLRRQIPIVCNENKATYDFLSGKKFKLKDINILKIVIKLK